MTELLWAGPEDSDEEIEEIAKYRTPWEEEEGVKFSKRGLIEYIERMIKQESAKNKDDPANAKLWEQKLKQPGLTYYLKKGNSKVRPTQPYFRSDFTFNRKYQMQKLVKCIYFPEEASKWDKNVEKAEFISCKEGNRCYGFTYVLNKKHATIKARDFYDKGFNFYHNGKYYRYSTAVNNSEDIYPVPKDTFRGETIYNFGIM